MFSIYIKFDYEGWLDAVNTSINSIHNAVKHAGSSQLSLQKFKACVNVEKISYNEFMMLDV